MTTYEHNSKQSSYHSRKNEVHFSSVTTMHSTVVYNTDGILPSTKEEGYNLRKKLDYARKLLNVWHNFKL